VPVDKEKLKEREKAGGPTAEGDALPKADLDVEQILQDDRQRKLLIDESVTPDELDTPMLILASVFPERWRGQGGGREDVETSIESHHGTLSRSCRKPCTGWGGRVGVSAKPPAPLKLWDGDSLADRRGAFASWNSQLDSGAITW